MNRIPSRGQSVCRALISLCLLIGASSLGAAPNGFGRFGYGGEIPILRFEVDKTGFKVRHPLADKLTFENPATQWKPLATSETAQTVGLNAGKLSPEKLRVNLYGAGFELYYPSGIALHSQSLSAPYLSWSDGSAGPGVPTPAVKWLLVSFHDQQPPILFGFPGAPCAMKLEGTAGNWRLKSERPFAGWVRVVAPLGMEPFRTNSAGELGNLVARIKSDVGVYSQNIPNLVSISIDEDPNGVNATWRFDAPGAVLPAPVLLAPLGGYPLRATGGMRSLQCRDAAGPVVVATAQSITLRFPVRRVPTGRFLAIGNVPWAAPATVSAIDVPSLVELAFANLGSQRLSLAKQAAANALDEFLRNAIYEQEPNTGQILPYSASGRGLDVAAAQALLMQCAMNAEKATSEPNSVLTTVIWRRDWYTWKIWAADNKMSRRSTAIAALASAICPEKERRLDSGMLQAGLAADRGLRSWRKANGITNTKEEEIIEVLEPLRNALFAMNGHPPEQDAFLKMLQSEIRVYGELAIVAEKGPDALALTFQASDANTRTLILSSAYPLSIVPGQNIASAEAQDALGFTIIKYTPKKEGNCELWLQAPPWADPLPKALPLLRYEETTH